MMARLRLMMLSLVRHQGFRERLHRYQTLSPAGVNGQPSSFDLAARRSWHLLHVAGWP